uniref:Heat shock protein 70 n=1 Tax=Mesocestoides corti TaxID=53468 RepID=A0A5K3EV89_MESCO
MQIVQNKEGSRITPSAIRFTKPRLFGMNTRAYAHEHIKETVHDVKRLIGRTYTDPVVSECVKSVGFDVISAMILEELKDDAEKYLGYPATEAVITVPASFNDAQRMATKHAGMIAGFKVLAIINEPTAAALTWVYENRETALDGNKKVVLVFDMGGGTTDISIVSIDENDISVTSTVGDNQLGGNDIDKMLMDHFVQEIKDTYDRDISQNPRSMAILRKNCIDLKHQLSLQCETRILVDGLIQGKTIELKMSSPQFECVIDDIIEKTIKLIRKALKLDLENNCGGENIDITNVVLVGGSSRMPWCKRIFEESIPGNKPVWKSVNPDEAVALGAGLYAAKLKGSSLCPNVRLLDVAPLSYGVEIRGGKMSNLIKRNTPLPFTCKRTFTTVEDNQRSVQINIYVGDKEQVAQNKKLQELELPLRPVPKGVPDIEVTFSLSQEFILNVTAKDLAINGDSKNVSVNVLKRLTREEIDRMSFDSQRMRKTDEQESRRLKLREQLERLSYRKKAKDVLAWLAHNRNASVEILQAKLVDLLNL